MSVIDLDDWIGEQADQLVKYVHDHPDKSIIEYNVPWDLTVYHSDGAIATACGYFSEALAENGIGGDWDVTFFPITRKVRVELYESEEEKYV